jgi:hypothetical protein
MAADQQTQAVPNLTALPAPQNGQGGQGGQGGAALVPLGRLPAALSLLPDREEWQTMCHMADALYKSDLLPDHIKNVQMAVAIIQKGRELQLQPMFALCNLYVIGGKPAANAEIIAALIYRDHGDNALIIDRTDEEECVIRYRRRSWPTGEYRTHAFTMEDARQAKLTDKDMWRKYPANMLRARCISAIGHMAYQDSLGGLYTPEEMGAVVDAAGTVIRMPDPPPGSRPTQSGGAGDVQDADFRPTVSTRGARPAAPTRKARGAAAPAQEPVPAQNAQSGKRTVDRATLLRTVVQRQGMLSNLGIAVPDLPDPDALTTAQLVETCKGYRSNILAEYQAVREQAKAADVAILEWEEDALGKAELEEVYEETLRVGLLIDELERNAATEAEEREPLATTQL